MNSNVVQIKKHFPLLKLENLDKQTLEIFKAHSSMPVKDYKDKNKIVNEIHVVINTTLMDAGFRMEVEDITSLQIRVTDDIFKSFPLLTLEDIKICFYDGVRSKYGKYFGLSPITFYSWLEHYNNNVLPEANLKIKQNTIPKEIQNEEPLMSQKEVDQLMYKKIIGLCVKLGMNPNYQFDDHFNIYYNFCVRIGILNFDEERTKKILQKAKHQLKEELYAKNVQLERAGKQFHKISLEMAYHHIDKETKGSEYVKLINIKAKKIALIEFVKELIEKKIDVSGLILSKLKAIHYD